MNKQSRTRFAWEFISDSLCLILANLISFGFFRYIYIKIIDYPIYEWVMYAILLLISYIIVFSLFHKNIDIHNRNRKNEVFSVFSNSTLIYLSLTALLTLSKNQIITSRYLLISSYALTFVFSALARYYLKRILTGHFKKSKDASLVGVITTSDIAENFIEGLSENWSIDISGIALLDDQFQNSSNGKVAVKEKIKTSICNIPVIATDSSYLDWIRSAPLDEVYINLPYKESSEIQEIVEELEDMGITVHINIPMLDKMLDESKFDNINCKIQVGYPMATFSASVNDERLMIIKRLLDILFGIIGCILSIPIIAILAIPLLIESPGPLIFKQDRVGKNGRIFKCYKLRSMYVDAEKRKADLISNNEMNGFMFKIDNDPRITKVGKFIRKYSIDELPQFFNVLIGDMSLIGTRPPTVDEFNKYESRHKRRLSMRPGITGMWQVSGRSDIQDFEDVVKLDCKYIDEWSPWLDTKIFFKTIYVVLTHKGAK